MVHVNVGLTVWYTAQGTESKRERLQMRTSFQYPSLNSARVWSGVEMTWYLSTAMAVIVKEETNTETDWVKGTREHMKAPNGQSSSIKRT